MSAPLYVTGNGGNITFDTAVFSVKEWKGTDEVGTDDVSTTGSGGFREEIPTLRKFDFSATLFYNPAATPLGSATGKIQPGKYGAFSNLVATSGSTYAGTALVVKVGTAVASSAGVTFDVEFHSTGAVTVTG